MADVSRMHPMIKSLRSNECANDITTGIYTHLCKPSLKLPDELYIHTIRGYTLSLSLLLNFCENSLQRWYKTMKYDNTEFARIYESILNNTRDIHVDGSVYC